MLFGFWKRKETYSLNLYHNPDDCIVINRMDFTYTYVWSIEYDTLNLWTHWYLRTTCIFSFYHSFGRVMLKVLSHRLTYVQNMTDTKVFWGGSINVPPTCYWSKVGIGSINSKPQIVSCWVVVFDPILHS